MSPTGDATPRELSYSRPVQPTIHTKDAGTHAPVAGKVRGNGVEVAPANSPLTHAFQPVQRRIRIPEIGEWVVIEGAPSVTVAAPRYRETAVDLVLRN